MVKDIRKNQIKKGFNIPEEELIHEEYVEPGGYEEPAVKQKSKPAFLSKGWRKSHSEERSKVHKERIEVQKKKLEEKIEKETLKQKTLELKYDAQLNRYKRENVKAMIAESKKRQREARFGGQAAHKVESGLKTMFTIQPPTGRERAIAGKERAHTMRERAAFRQELEGHREYQKKFPVRPEGDGELPFYEASEGKPLNPVQRDAPAYKKKSFKEELF